MTTVEERLQRLEDREVIRELNVAHVNLADAADLDGLVGLFTDDVVYDGGQLFGIHEGKATVRAFLAEEWKERTWAVRYVTGETITVAPSGTEARGTWHLWEAAIYRGRAIWFASRYEDEYRKIAGRWKIARIKNNNELNSPFETGWVKERFLRGR